MRTRIVNDSLYEGSESVLLKAYTFNNAEASGSATILDDGTATLYDENGNPTGGTLNDDRPVPPPPPPPRPPPPPPPTPEPPPRAPDPVPEPSV